MSRLNTHRHTYIHTYRHVNIELEFCKTEFAKTFYQNKCSINWTDHWHLPLQMGKFQLIDVIKVNLWLLQYLKIVQIGNHHTKCEANQNVNQPNWALRGKCHLKHLLAPGARFCARIAQWIWTYYKCTRTHTEYYANARYLYTMWKTHLLQSRQVF